jgi:sugar/nucleoside kinase (ribokinase family)
MTCLKQVKKDMRIAGIGLANIDLIDHVDDDFLTRHDLIKGQAQKLPYDLFIKLRNELSDIHIEAGGCVGNTLCGIKDNQIDKIMFSKIGHDEYENIYRDGFKEFNVTYDVPAAPTDSSQCLVLITPDGDRTFAYIHGASWTLSSSDIDFEIISRANLIYTEIYAMAFGMQTGLWPSLINRLRDTPIPMVMKVVDREYMNLYRTAIFGLAEEGVLTLLIGNKDNLCGLARRDTIEETLDNLSKWKCAILLTDGADGAYYRSGNTHFYHPVEAIANPENTSGAGDQFVAGFLEKWLDNKSIPACMENAEQSARQVLMNDAPRPHS